MTNKYYRFISILLLLLGLAASHTVQAAPEVEVLSADPATAPQGTLSLDVTIGGKGFDKSAKVQFLISGTSDPGGIAVGRTKVSGSTQIVANIEISDTAIVADYDIIVTMSRGRGGKGTTLFKIQSSDSPAPNNDGSAIEMTCALGEDADTLSTLGNDLIVNPDSNIGSPYYFGGLEKVQCQSGGVTGETLAGLRLATMPGGNLRKAIRFVDLDFGPCVDGFGCLPQSLEDALPAELLEASPDAIQLDVRPYKEDGHTHIHLMTHREHTNPYKMAVSLWPEGFAQRYLIQMVGRQTQPGGGLGGSHSCHIDSDSDPEGFWPSQDVNVYIWSDGAFSGVQDGLPDGYTVTTGEIFMPETIGEPPTVTPGTAEGVICSNKSLSGESCPGGPKFRDALCHMLGEIPLRFTLHMEYQ